MKLGFSLRAYLACVVLAIANVVFASFADAVTVGTAAPLATARSNHTATQLTNGKLLVAGGQAAAPASTPLTSAELYDPFANAWSAAAALPVARSDHTATLLDNGRVLIVGGRSVAGSDAALATAVLYDPTTNTWSNAGNLAAARAQHTATRLRNGKVLVVGGKHNTTLLASAELYDPATNAWTSAGSLATARRFHTATAASAGINDDVVVIGGSVESGSGVTFGLASIERYSAATNSWFTFTAQLGEPRYSHTATALPNGDILVAGGLSARLSGLSVVRTTRDNVERFAFSTFTVALAGNLRDARGRHSATLLPSGKLMLIGGIEDGASPAYLSSIETFDPATGNSTLEPAMATVRADHTATLIPTGALIAVGGSASATVVTAATVLSRVNDANNGVISAGGACGASFYNTVTLLPDGRLLIVGGVAPVSNVRLNTVQLFNPANGSCANLTPLAVARDRHATTLLPNGKLLITGGLEANWVARNSAELYDPIANTTTPLPPMQRVRALHSQTLMPDGRVLVAGGVEPTPSEPGDLFEYFDPATNTWSAQSTVIPVRIGRAATLLPNGELLLSGGTSDSGSCDDAGAAYKFNPTTGGIVASLLPLPACEAKAILLANGNVLLSAPITPGAIAIFNSTTQTWSQPALLVSRSRHAVTLLHSGEVLISGIDDNFARTTEIYDPVTNSVRYGPTLAIDRAGHQALALPDGRVVAIGGVSTQAVTPEYVDFGFAPNVLQRPALGIVNTSLTQSNALNATGLGFRPTLEASGGDTAQSASNAPVFELQRIDDGRRIFLPQAPVSLFGSTPFTDTSFVSASAVAAGFPHGHALVRTWVNGTPSVAKNVIVATTPSPPSVIVALLSGATSANVSFLNSPTFDGGSPITRYVFTSDPPGGTATCNAPCGSAVVAGLTPGTTYTFRVAAENAQGIGSAFAPSNQVVVPRRTSTTTVASSLNPSTFGQAVTFTATVLAANNGPINEAVGTVRFSIGGNTIAGCGAVPVVLASVPVFPVTYRASCTTSALNVPGGQVLAEFLGDRQTDLSNGSVTHTVERAAQNISNLRFEVTGAGVVTQVNLGQLPFVRFNPGASSSPVIVAVAVASAGICSLTMSASPNRYDVIPLALGTCNVTVNQAGDSNYLAAPEQTATLSVLDRPNVALAIVPNRTLHVGQYARLNVAVSGVAPTGTVTITSIDPNVSLFGCVAMPLTGSGNTRTASCLLRANTPTAGDENAIAANYSGDGNHVANSVAIGSPEIRAVPSLNIDLSPAPGTRNDAATDGLMILRYLAGFTGTAITDNAMHPSFDRSIDEVPPYLESIRDALDVNSDGRFDLAIDGVLIVRYMQGLRTATGLFNGVAIGSVMTASEIENYLAALMP